jgi:hypothetical protein
VSNVVSLDERRSIKRWADSLRVSPHRCGLCKEQWLAHTDDQMVEHCTALGVMRQEADAVVEPARPSDVDLAILAMTSVNMATNRFDAREAEALARETIETIVRLGWRK